MLKMLLVVVQQVGVLFLLMAVGFVLGKLNWLDGKCAGQLSRLLIYVVGPCALIQALQIDYSSRITLSLFWGCLFLPLPYFALILISRWTFRREEPDTQPVLRFAQVYSNNVFMGLPLLQATLGQTASVFVVPSMVVFQIFQWTHGVQLMGGRLSLKRAVINPGIVGITIGLFFYFLRAALPSVCADAVGFLAGMNTPLAMVVVGVQMAGNRLSSTFRQPKLYAVSGIRLLLAPLITMILMLPLRFMDPLLYCALVILASTPVAGVTSIFAQEYGRDVTSAANAISLSTLLSIFTLPLFAVLAQLAVS